jgi:molybdate/tungstate transport system permease protein
MKGAAPSRPLGLLLLFWLLGLVLLAFIVLPLVALAARQTGADLARVAGMIEVQQAILLSVEGSILATLLAGLVGVPLAYLLARAEFPGKAVVSAIVDIPLSVPHPVAGIALLMVFGRQGVLGEAADAAFGLKFWGTVAGVVVAMLFVAAPFTVNAARLGFEAVDPRLEKVARTLGMDPWRTFLTVTLPLSWRSIMTGFTLTFARAISEFGAVVVLVYYPMTAPVEVYELFIRFGLDDAGAAALLLLAVTLILFIALRALAYGRGAPAGSGR